MPITFTKTEFAALVAHTSKDADRVNLTQIAIWDDGSAAATDGHRMLMCRPQGGEAWTNDRGKPTLVSRDASIRALKLMKAKDKVYLCEGYTLRVNGVDVQFEGTSETFPPVHAVAKKPTSEPDGFVGVDAGLLGDTLAHLTKIRKPAKLPTVRMSTAAALDPIYIECEDLDNSRDWLAVVMPCRI